MQISYTEYLTKNVSTEIHEHDKWEHTFFTSAGELESKTPKTGKMRRNRIYDSNNGHYKIKRILLIQSTVFNNKNDYCTLFDSVKNVIL